MGVGFPTRAGKQHPAIWSHLKPAPVFVLRCGVGGEAETDSYRIGIRSGSQTAYADWSIRCFHGAPVVILQVQKSMSLPRHDRWNPLVISPPHLNSRSTRDLRNRHSSWPPEAFGKARSRGPRIRNTSVGARAASRVFPFRPASIVLSDRNYVVFKTPTPL